MCPNFLHFDVSSSFPLTEDYFKCLSDTDQRGYEFFTRCMRVVHRGLCVQIKPRRGVNVAARERFPSSIPPTPPKLPPFHCRLSARGPQPSVFPSHPPHRVLLSAAVPLSCSEGFTELGYYNGTVSQTDSGAPCLKWTEFPDYVMQYPGRGLGDHSYCRNPDRESNPWCFFRQNSGAIGWAYCDCHQGTELRASQQTSL